MRTLFALLVVALPLVAAPVPKGLKKPPDGTEVYGTWQLVRYDIKGQPGGFAKNTDYRFEAGKSFVVYTDSGSEAPLGYTFDAAGVEWRTNPNAKPALGSYKVDGDTLYLVHAYDPTDPRPTEFAPGERVFYAELRRKPSAK